MKVRGATTGTPFAARLTVLCWGALTLLAPVAVSACTSSSSTTTPTVISPTVTGTDTASASTSSGTSPSSGSTSPTGTPGVASDTSTAHPVVTVTQTITTTPTSTVTSTVPSGAPVTGGGGTAGFQGTALLVLGAGAILAGAGGLGYRRWLGRRR
jgi:hypothetical protein